MLNILHDTKIFGYRTAQAFIVILLRQFLVYNYTKTLATPKIYNTISVYICFEEICVKHGNGLFTSIRRGAHCACPPLRP